MLTNTSPSLRARTMRLARWLAAIGLAGGILSACGGSASSSSSTSTSTSASAAVGSPTHLLNTKRIEVAIEQSILSERKLHSKVTCPKAVPQQKGRTFSCIAETKSRHGKVKTVFTVLQKNSSGQVNYASPK
jgi:hypothetical protein